MKVLFDPGTGEGAGAGGGAPPAAILDGKPGSGTPGFVESLPEEFRKEPSLQNFKSVADLAKSYVSASKMIGLEKIPAPQKNWGEKEWGEFWGKLGRPETPDKYGFNEGFKVPDGVQIDDATMGEWKKEFHALGLTKKQADALLTKYVERESGNISKAGQAAEAARIQGLSSLKEKYGADTDIKINTAKAVLNKFGGEDLVQKLVATGLANDPKMVEMFASLGEMMLEDNARGEGKNLIVTDQVSARREMETLKTDKEYMAALTEATHPGHKAAFQRWNTLLNVAYQANKAA